MEFYFFSILHFFPVSKFVLFFHNYLKKTFICLWSWNGMPFLFYEMWTLVSFYFGIKGKFKQFKDQKGTTKLRQFTSSAESFKFDHYMSFLRPLWPLNSNRWLLLSMQYVLPSLPLTKQSSKQQKKTIKREYKLPIQAYFTGQLI